MARSRMFGFKAGWLIAFVAGMLFCCVGPTPAQEKTPEAPPAKAPATLADLAEQQRFPQLTKALAKATAAQANITQVDGTTALHWAAHHGAADAVAGLLRAGADANVTNLYEVAPLSLACQIGNAGVVRHLLKADADPNTSLPGGETALMTASRTGKLAPVELLLEKKAKVDTTDRKGQSAIMWAAADGNAEVVERLLKAGADPVRQLRSGLSPMLFAARNGHLNVVQTLLAAGVEVNAVTETSQRGGRNPGAGVSALRIAVENGHFELATALLKVGADPDDQRSGRAPLHVLVHVRKPPRGDGVSGAPPPQGSGLMTSLAFARELIEVYGADVNLQLKSGSSGNTRLGTRGATAFLLASQTADLPYLKLLHELGADPTITNHDNTTPLLTAAGLGAASPTEEAGTEDECLATVAWLIELGADVNARNKRGETSMHGAAYKNFPKMVHYLAANGADINLWNQKNRSGWTPLMLAQGFRPGNFKPDKATTLAIEAELRAAGVEVPPPPARPSVGRKQEYKK